MIETVEDAEELFNVQFTNSQYMDILNFLAFGVIPEADGCTSCDRAFVREYIGKIQAHNAQFEEPRSAERYYGEEPWPEDRV